MAVLGCQCHNSVWLLLIVWLGPISDKLLSVGSITHWIYVHTHSLVITVYLYSIPLVSTYTLPSLTLLTIPTLHYMLHYNTCYTTLHATLMTFVKVFWQTSFIYLVCPCISNLLQFVNCTITQSVQSQRSDLITQSVIATHCYDTGNPALPSTSWCIASLIEGVLHI